MHKNLNRRLFFGVFLLLGLSSDALWSGSGTTTANYLRMNAPPRAVGMGEAFCALADDVGAMHWNPGGLGFILNPQVETIHNFWLGGVSNDFLGYVQPLGRSSLGLNVSYLNAGQMDRITRGVADGRFTAYDLYGGLSYGVAVTRTFSLGFNIMGLDSTIDRDTTYSFSSDVGIIASNKKHTFLFGLVGQNIGNSLRGDQLPVNIKAGIASRIKFAQEGVDLAIALDANKPLEGDFNFSLGLEHTLFRTFSARVGYKYDLAKNGRSNLAGLRAGAGINLKGLLVNYAWAPYEFLGTVHSISLGYKFGKQERPAKIKLVLQADSAIFSPNGDGVNDTIELVIAGDNLKRAEEWHLSIKDKEGADIWSRSGGTLPVSVPWDGTDFAGILVPDGLYICQIEAREWGRLPAKSELVPVLVDTTPPESEVIAIPEKFSPDGDGIDDKVSLRVSAWDNTDIKRWLLEIYTREAKLAKTFMGEGAPPPSIVWDGGEDYYKAVAPPGDYWARLVLYDIVGNKCTSSCKVTIEKAPPPPPKLPEGIKVEEEKRGLKITFSVKVLFGVGKSNLREDSYSVLDEAIKLLREYPLNKISVEGHTDSVGSFQYNQKLSELRAKAVYDYLVQKGGIEPARLAMRGWGEEKPIASNDTAKGRELNRRVEIIILKEGEQ